MPVQGFNTGKDVTLVIVTPTGTLEISGITGFQSAQMTNPLDHKGINGNNIYAEIPTGWEGTFDLDRTDGSLDSYFAQAEAAYYNGNDPGVATITETITESSGISQFRYTGVALKFADAGTWRGDQKVSQRVSFRASLRQQVQ